MPATGPALVRLEFMTIGDEAMTPGRSEVFVYFVRVDAIGPFDALRDEALLDDEERRRCRAFLRDEDRAVFRAAHALLRRALSRHGAVRPEQWRFTCGAHGRPALDPAMPEATRVLFNLTHTQGLAACAVSVADEGSLLVGVDAERTTRQLDLEGISSLVYDPRERAMLDRLIAHEKRRRFFTLWTLKEAWLKARGYGMTVDPRTVRFEFASDDARRDLHPRAVCFSPSLPQPEEPARWAFSVRDLTDEHLCAVAVYRSDHAAAVPVRYVDLSPRAAP